MRNFIQPGKVLTAVAVADVTSGEFVKIGAIFGIASTSAKTGEQFELATGEVFEMSKPAAEAWVFGDEIYADADGIATKTATDNTKIGVAAAPAANPSGTGNVRLNDNF